MKIGMPSLIELESFEQNVALCRELDLSFIELNMNMPQFQLSELKSFEPLSDIEVTLHLPEELNVWDFNDTIREAYFKVVENTIKLSMDKNIRILNLHMHPGIYFTLPNKKIFLFSKYIGKYLENTKLFAEKIEDMIEKTNIIVCIENTGLYNNDFIIESVRELLTHDCFKLTWDTGHDYASGKKDTAFIRNHMDKVKHLHLHDAIDAKDHLPLGTGDLNIKEIFYEANCYVESVVLETKTVAGLKQSIGYLKEKTLVE